MTTCNICKLTLGKSIEEGICECPKFYTANDGKTRIVWRGYPMMLDEFMRLQKS